MNLTHNLNKYLKNFDYDINRYKVVCFVPADGCGKCIYPALEYSKKADAGFILVLSSNYSKSINNLIDTFHIEKSNLIIDLQNQASNMKLVPIIAPCVYFLQEGRVIKIVDLSTKLDQTSIYKEVQHYLSK